MIEIISRSSRMNVISVNGEVYKFRRRSSSARLAGFEQRSEAGRIFRNVWVECDAWPGERMSRLKVEAVLRHLDLGETAAQAFEDAQEWEVRGDQVRYISWG